MDRPEMMDPAARTIDLRLEVTEEVQALLARLDELEASQNDRTRA